MNTIPINTARGTAARRRAAKSGRAGRAKSCPICGAPAVATLRPFCSSRCADVDLGRWLAGDYRIPVSEDDESEEDGPAGGAAADDGDEDRS